MIDALRLTTGWALVWFFGVAIVAAFTGGAASNRRDEWPWTIGCGFFAGAFAATAWMRALSLAAIDFSVWSIGMPIAFATVVLAWYASPGLRMWVVRSRRPARETLPASSRIPPPAARASWRTGQATMARGQRIVLYVVVAWLGLRFALLLLDVIWTPLYPWDAWIQWATKARVWYALGHIVPFARSDAWFAADGAMWFDASPNYPATVPLWQVWSSVALGRWDDALMNVPWWLTAVAFTIAVYGALRAEALSAFGAMIGAWLVSSLPLANVHVALAGYADLPMAAYFALAALAVWRWSRRRTYGDAALALLLALACVTIKTPGVVWALTLVPGVVVAVMPRLGPRLVTIGLLVVLGTLAVLAQTSPVVLGYRLQLDFAPAWQALVGSLFLLGSWHLLWYAVIVAAIVAWTQLRTPALAPLSAIVGSGVLFLLVAFSFTNARNWVTDQTTINRALLHLAPLALVWTMLVLHAWLARNGTAGSAAPASAAV
jgi:hypothetical protein